MTIVSRRFAAFAAISSVLFLSACGGGDRPSVDEIKAGLGGEASDFMPTGDAGELTDEQLTCMAEVLHESDISDEGLRAIVDQDDSYQESEEDRTAMMAEISSLAECTGVDLGNLGG